MIKNIAYSILLLTIGGIIGYFLQNINTVITEENKASVEKIATRTNTELIEKNKAHLEEAVADFFSEEVTGRLSLSDDYFDLYKNTLSDMNPIWTLPEEPNSDLPIGDLKGFKTFDPNEGWGEYRLYSQMFDPSQPPKWKESSMDIDSDGVAEKIMINNMIMTGQPHLIRIVKNERVVFEFTGESVAIKEVSGRSGFLISRQRWQDQNGVIIRYVIDEDGLIKPLWQQRHIGIELWPLKRN